MNTQNLNETGSVFWHGRTMWKRIRCEWNFGKRANFCHAYAELLDDGKMRFSFALPRLFALWFSVTGFSYDKKPVRIGAAIHNQSAWLYIGDNPHESSSSDPWYRKSYAWSFPWTYSRCVTEVLEHKAFLPGLQGTVWSDKNQDFLKSWDARKKAEASVSEVYDYTYTRQSGEVQKRKATVFVERRTWKMKWWPILPFKRSRTTIDVAFDDEVGEGTGSWKGGTVGCGYDMKLGETPLVTLRRMERERKFSR